MADNINLTPETGKKVRSIWDIIKTVIEIIIAAIAGAATATTAQACGLLALLS